jgi:hypothetical protein
MSKTVFVAGGISTGVNVYEVAGNIGLLKTPALVCFTFVIGIIICLMGGITFVVFGRWIGRKFDRIINRYDRWMLK